MNFMQTTVSFLLFIPTILVKIVLFLLMIFLLKFLYRHQEKVLQYRQFWVLLCSTICCCLIWNFQYQNLKKKRAFVVKESVYVYAGPEKSFHKILQLPLGTDVYVLNTHHEMSQILVNGQCGWVLCDEIKVV